jgi:hypothetical protein
LGFFFGLPWIGLVPEYKPQEKNTMPKNCNWSEVELTSQLQVGKGLCMSCWNDEYNGATHKPVVEVVHGVERVWWIVLSPRTPRTPRLRSPLPDEYVCIDCDSLTRQLLFT